MKLSLKFEKFEIYHIFHIVPNDFAIPTTGLIGKDFIKLYSCVLDNGNRSFVIRTKLGEARLDMNCNGDTITLPPRSEIFRVFKIENVTKFPAVIPSREIDDGVFCATTVIFDKTPTIRLVNTTNRMKSIQNAKFIAKHISEYKILKLNENSGTKRTELLLKILENKSPIQSRSKLMALCREFSDIFAMEGDKATQNNFYVQELNVTDPTPVYTKNYRMPHSQKSEISKQIGKLLENELIEPSDSPYNYFGPEKIYFKRKNLAPLH